MTSRTRIAIAAAIATALGSLALLPVYSTWAWMPRSLGAILVVFAIAEGARLVGLPSPIASLCALAGLAGFVTAEFAASAARFVVIPGGDARAALRAQVHAGFHDISRLQAPVPPNKGLMLLTVAGIGLVAVAVDALACGGRRPALAGLPLLALFAVPAATTTHGVGVTPFLCAGAGYLVLLQTESRERVSRWGRPLGAGQSTPDGTPPLLADRAETAPLAQIGRRVGAAALGAAVVVPLLIPGLHSGLFGDAGGNGHGHGRQTVTTYNPITRIQRQLISPTSQPLFSYTTSAKSDFPYFRMTALDLFNGATWSAASLTAPSSHRVDHGVPAPPGLSTTVPTSQVQTSVLGRRNFAVPWLPIPYPSNVVDANGDWRWEGHGQAVFSTTATTAGLTWATETDVPNPSVEQLQLSPPVVASGDLAADLDYNLRQVPQLLISDALHITRNAHTPYAKALAIQNWFRNTNRFTYDTHVIDANSTDAIHAFLTDRRGYCVQFASTMALMARVVGIPARIAIGFTHGDLQADGTHLVTTRDAHAWPELYFTGFGWLPFEPTPRSDGQATPPPWTQSGTSAGNGDKTGQSGPEAKPTSKPGTKTNTGPRIPEHQGANSIGGTAKNNGGGGPSGRGVAAIIVLAVLAVAPATGRWLTRRRRWADAETPAALAHAAWAEVADDTRDLGIAWRPDDSPRRAAARLATRTGLATGAAAALRRLAAARELATYAPASAVGATGSDGFADLAQEVRRVRRGLRGTVGRWARVRSVLMPMSAVRRGTSAFAGRIADGLDLVDDGLAGLRRTLTPHRARRSQAS